MPLKQAFFLHLLAVFMLAALPLAAKDEKPPQQSYVQYESTNKDGKVQAGGELLLPEGHGPFPLMVIIHGSGGVVKEREYVYAQELNAMGVAAFIVDSFTPRGVKSTYNDQNAVFSNDMAEDAFMALMTLSTNPKVDVTRAGIIGFSKGATAVFRTALRSQAAQSKTKGKFLFKFHALYYPGCSSQPYNLITQPAPLYMMLGEDDQYINNKACRLLADKLQKAGADIHLVIYPKAGHAWDVPGTWEEPKAESYRNCLFEQQQDGTWTEKTSGIKGMKSQSGEVYDKALKACLVYGAKGEGSEAARAKGIADLKLLVKKYLLK